MRTGFLISGGAHLALLVAMVVQGFAVPAADRAEEEIVLSDVDILSDQEFQAMFSRAPDFVPTDPGQLALPDELAQDAAIADPDATAEIAEVEGPDDPSERDTDPDLSAVLERNAVTARVDAATLTPTLPQDQDFVFNLPQAPSTPARPTPQRPTLGRPAPQRPSLNISTQAAAPPPEDTTIADEAQEEIARGQEVSETPLEEQEATALEEAATDIVPQIAQDLPDVTGTELEPVDPTIETAGIAPTASAPPPARPTRPAPEPDAEPETETETAATPPAEPAAPLGEPLTAADRDGARAAFNRNWNRSTLDGLPNAAELVVTVGFTLNQDGTLASDIRPIVPANPTGAFERAFQLARRTVLMTISRGELRLPPEKYARWREVEVTFDPGANQIGF